MFYGGKICVLCVFWVLKKSLQAGAGEFYQGSYCDIKLMMDVLALLSVFWVVF